MNQRVGRLEPAGDIAIQSGQPLDKIARALAYQMARNFEDIGMPKWLFEVGTYDLLVNNAKRYIVTSAKRVKELELRVTDISGNTWRTVPDNVVIDSKGFFHIGEMKFSSFNKNWDTAWRSASTTGQKDLIDGLKAGTIQSITVIDPNISKLSTLGIAPGSTILPSNIKSITLIGSEPGKLVVKTVKRLF